MSDKQVLGYTVPAIPNSRVRITKEFVRFLKSAGGKDKLPPIQLFTSRFSNVGEKVEPELDSSTRCDETVPPRLEIVRIMVPPHLSSLLSTRKESERRLDNSQLLRGRLKQAKVSRTKSLRKQQRELPPITPPQRAEQQAEVKSSRPSPCFVSAQRKSLANENEVPGPGYYQVQQQHTARPKQVQPPQPQHQQQSLKIRRQLLQQLTAESKQVKQKQRQARAQIKPERGWPCFKVQNHDRFGEAVFPVVCKFKPPSPGRYQFQSMESDMRRRQRDSHCRKAVRLWLHQ